MIAQPVVETGEKEVCMGLNSYAHLFVKLTAQRGT
jgi:hypothetical protein